MGINPDWDAWDPTDLILDERISGWSRFVDNFVQDGFGLSDGGGLNLIVGGVGTSYAYINGYEIAVVTPQILSLADNATNHVFLGFTKTPDPGGGTGAITILFTVNTTGIPPADSIKLGEVMTAGGVVTAINEQDNRFKVHDAQFTTDLGGNRHQITELVIHGGTAFPASPVSGQMFWRTDLLTMYVFNGATWVAFAASTTALTIAAICGELVMDSGSLVYISGTGTVALADASIPTKVQVVGATVAAAVFAGPVDVSPDRTASVRFDPASPVPAPGDDVFLSVGGLATTTEPPPPLTSVYIGTVFDTTGFIPFFNPVATVVLRIEEPIFQA